MNLDKIINTPKTPVSVLTEMMVKNCSIPKWELVHDGGGTHENLFIYKVICNGYVAQGEGRNKKDAKHQAATNMLELLGQQSILLQLPAMQHSSPVETPQPMESSTCPMTPNVPFRNTVGELKDLCGYNNLEEPRYKETADIGPPHAKVFTIQCSVSTFTEEGIATTKKQAKHEAARKMLERIKDNLESVKKDHQVIINYNDEDEEMADLRAAELYPELSLRANDQSKLKVSLGIKIKDYHKSFKEYFVVEEKKFLFLENIEIILELIQKNRDNFNVVIFKELKDKFIDLLASIDVRSYESNLDSVNEGTYVSCLRINTAPDIVEIAFGNSELEAHLKTLQNVLESMKLLLS